MKPAFLILATLAAFCGGLIAWGIIWDHGIRPRNTIPKPPPEHQPFHALPGLGRLAAQARLRDSYIDPRYIIHMPKADTSNFEAQVLYLGARLGWLTHRGGIHNEVLATIPEEDLAEIQRMTVEPRAWLLEAMERTPVPEVKPGPVINVGIDLDGYHGRSLQPFIPIGLGIAGLAALLIAAVIIIVVEAEKRKR